MAAAAERTHIMVQYFGSEFDTIPSTIAHMSPSQVSSNYRIQFYESSITSTPMSLGARTPTKRASITETIPSTKNTHAFIVKAAGLAHLLKYFKDNEKVYPPILYLHDPSESMPVSLPEHLTIITHEGLHETKDLKEAVNFIDESLQKKSIKGNHRRDSTFSSTVADIPTPTLSTPTTHERRASWTSTFASVFGATTPKATSKGPARESDKSC